MSTKLAASRALKESKAGSLKKAKVSAVKEKLVKPQKVVKPLGKVVIPTRRRVVAKPVVTVKAPRKPHRFRPGTVALRNIKRHQLDYGFKLRKLPVRRIIVECLRIHNGGEPVRVSPEAIRIYQDFLERYLIALIADAHKIAYSYKYITARPMNYATVINLRRDKLIDLGRLGADFNAHIGKALITPIPPSYQ
jgi:histone H3